MMQWLSGELSVELGGGACMGFKSRDLMTHGGTNLKYPVMNSSAQATKGEHGCNIEVRK
jgi:hypothetical protein